MTAPHQSLVFRALCLVLLTSIAWTASDLALLQVEAAIGQDAQRAGPLEPGPVDEAPVSIELEAITRRNLFDSSAKPEPAAAPAESAAAEAPSANEPVAPTSLPLVLRGTWVGSARGVAPAGEAPAWAIIEDPAARTQAIYEVGDLLPGGQAEIVDILPRAVTIRRDGELELLGFPEVWGEPAPAGGRPPRSMSAASAGADEIREIAPGRYVIGQRLLQHKLSNLTQVLTEARAIPVDGGFRIRSIKKGSFIEKLGVQNGDILRSVNGMQLGSIEQAMRAYKLLQREDRVRLEVLRGASTQTLDYEIR